MEKSAILKLNSVNVILPTDGKPLPIIRDISLSFQKGKSTAIVGPSGSGKTTLMMVCAGLQTPSSGEILFNGKELPVTNESALTSWRQENVGIVFQNFHLLPTNNALENVMLPLELAGRKDAIDSATRILDEVGLSHRLHHLPSQLSGGEQQRVALARAMARRPALLLADEPTGNLDSSNGKKVMELLFTQSKIHGTTLIIVTHDEHLAQSCDRVVSLADGVVVSAESFEDA